MAPVRLILLGLVLGGLPLGTYAQDVGRADRLWRLYLEETVARGLPLLADNPSPESVPYWPTLHRTRLEAESLEPGADTVLLGSWIALQEGDFSSPASDLKIQWPQPQLSFLPKRQWGEALFTSWARSADAKEWTRAWLNWEEKAYSPEALVLGIESLEHSDPSAVEPLLDQVVRLYPEDRRFLPLILRHRSVVAHPEWLVSRDLASSGGWSEARIRGLLDQSPETRAILVEAGYSAARLDKAVEFDYGRWLASASSSGPGDGAWTWDADHDGRAESRLVFANGSLVSWSRSDNGGGLWSLSFRSAQPAVMRETRLGSTWTLTYDVYPLAKSLEYRWGESSLLYKFRPLTQEIPLWPGARFQASAGTLPAALADLWMPVDPRALAAVSASVETRLGDIRTQVVYLVQGEVWMQIEDSDRDGRDDTWRYYRSGNLVSAYHDADGRGAATLREVYRKGELTQVQSRSPQLPKVEFALFPAEGIQLWDPHGQGKPLDRVFVWSGQDRLQALVFSGKALPWNTMPTWEPRP